MEGMRIYKKKHYILQSIPGISGFKQWNKRTYCICTGQHAQHNRLDIVKEFSANGKGEFCLADGHLPDYQPKAKEVNALHWLNNNPNSVIRLLNPESYSLPTEV